MNNVPAPVGKRIYHRRVGRSIISVPRVFYVYVIIIIITIFFYTDYDNALAQRQIEWDTGEGKHCSKSKSSVQQ